jgi:hypothetical protein
VGVIADAVVGFVVGKTRKNITYKTTKAWLRWGTALEWTYIILYVYKVFEHGQLWWAVIRM